MSRPPLASIIIPVWNGRDFLEACLRSLLAQTYEPLEIIAVDNGSSDGSAELIEHLFPTVRLIRNAHNLGFAGGCNVGLRAAQGELLLLLNQDTQADAGWVRALAEALQEPEAGIVGSQILYPDGRLQHAGGWIEWPLGLAHHHLAEDDARPVEFVTGAALGFPRAVVEKIGLLDEGFWPGYFEDVDFCLRARAAGFAVSVAPSAIVTHTESASTRDAATRARFYQRGRLRFLLKHLSPERFLADFVPAELAYQQPAIFGQESQPLRLAYLEAIPATVTLLQECWQASESTIQQIIEALQTLHQRAWAHEWGRVQATLGDAMRSIEPPQAIPSHTPLPPVRLPSLRAPTGEGSASPWLNRLHALWYRTVLRLTGVQEILHQQEAINATVGRAFNEVVAQTLAHQKESAEVNLEQLRLHQATLGQHLAGPARNAGRLHRRSGSGAAAARARERDPRA